MDKHYENVCCHLLWINTMKNKTTWTYFVLAIMTIILKTQDDEVLAIMTIILKTQDDD